MARVHAFELALSPKTAEDPDRIGRMSHCQVEALFLFESSYFDDVFGPFHSHLFGMNALLFWPKLRALSQPDNGRIGITAAQDLPRCDQRHTSTQLIRGTERGSEPLIYFYSSSPTLSGILLFFSILFFLFLSFLVSRRFSLCEKKGGMTEEANRRCLSIRPPCDC